MNINQPSSDVEAINEKPIRSNIYYWKCDRPAAFHGVVRANNDSEIKLIFEQLNQWLLSFWPRPFSLKKGIGKGNHKTFLLHEEEKVFFVRVEDGPEADSQHDVESLLLSKLCDVGLPVPAVYFTDTSRRHVPFAVQIIEYYPYPDLNRVVGQEQAMMSRFEDIGKAVASWQSIPVTGYGPFDPLLAAEKGILKGYHGTYESYFFTKLDEHLHFLVQNQFLSERESSEIRYVIYAHESLLALKKGCLVHKDLALWNILGTQEAIHAYIDWDDAISGDPVDDLSLLACFHSGAIIQKVIDGYESHSPLPPEFLHRFWLHLLRNMIVKSVIRCGAGYFKQSDSLFLMKPGEDGSSFQRFTRTRFFAAYNGLRKSLPLNQL